MKQKSEDEKSVLSKITPELFNSIKIEYNRAVVSKFKCLVENFSEDTITQVCLELQEDFFSPNQIVFNEGEVGDSSIMFLVSGQVDLFQEVSSLKTDSDKKIIEGIQMDYKIEKSSKFIFSLKKGTVFGELNFFTGMGRKLTAKSQQFSTILKLSRDSFLNILSKNSQDFEKFCEIKDKVILYSDYEPLKLGCSLCKSPQHFDTACPTSHFQKDSPFLFARYNFSTEQERNVDLKARNKDKLYHSFRNRQMFQEKAEQIQQNYELALPENTEEANAFKTYYGEDDEDENDQNGSSDDLENSKTGTTNQEKDEDTSIQKSPEQFNILGQVQSRISLSNAFPTLDERTRKTDFSREKQNSEYKRHEMNFPSHESVLRNNFQEDTVSLNIPTNLNPSTPKLMTRGTTMYQSSAERTDLTSYMKENLNHNFNSQWEYQNLQDSIRESDQFQKERLKKSRKSVLNDNRKRFSVRTDVSKLKRNTVSALKRSQFDREHYGEQDKYFKMSEGLQRFVSIRGESQQSHFEKLVLNSLWTFDSIRETTYHKQTSTINKERNTRNIMDYMMQPRIKQSSSKEK